MPYPKRLIAPLPSISIALAALVLGTIAALAQQGADYVIGPQDVLAITSYAPP